MYKTSKFCIRKILFKPFSVNTARLLYNSFKSLNKKKSAKKVIEKNILSVEDIDIEHTDTRSSRNKRKVSNNDSFDNDERIIQDSDGDTSSHDITPTNTPSKKLKN